MRRKASTHRCHRAADASTDRHSRWFRLQLVTEPERDAPDRRERNQIPDLGLSLSHNLLRSTYSRWLRFAKFHSSVALVSCQVNSSPDTTSLRS